ncbi:MAG: hypothetical protein OXG65_08375 [Chloroflexi bacterium]|nr:hypothetical protein [Chloroflexota bacterium]
MSRLPDEFRALLRLEVASGHATAEAGGPDTSASRMAMARLRRLYRYALRHPAPGRDVVLREVARQTLRHGPAHVLGRRTREARLFVSWGHQVHREVFAARTGLRFHPGRAPHERVATWNFTFPVVDLVLRDLHRRMRDYTLVIEDGSRRYVHDGCGIRLESRTSRTHLEPTRQLGRRVPALYALV